MSQNRNGPVATITPHLQGLHQGQRMVSDFPRRENVLFRHDISGRGEFGDEGGEELFADGAGGGELRFQLVH